jgi:hypothetical protein
MFYYNISKQLMIQYPWFASNFETKQINESIFEGANLIARSGAP